MRLPNINYLIYLMARSALHQSKRLVPNVLVPSSIPLSSRFAIGITTYIERYDLYFKPLYIALSKIFPQAPIIVAVNGCPDADAQRIYLERLNSELCAHAPQHHRFVLHQVPVGLTTLWNEILVLGLPQPLLILNDDLQVYPWLRRWSEKVDWQNVSLTLLNSTWSHFIITPKIIQKLGYFDSGFTGIGFEDMDYTALAGMLKVSIHDVLCPYLTHRNHQPKRTSFDTQSTRVWGKYTSANQQYFFNKWQECPRGEGVYIKQLKASVRPINNSLRICSLPSSIERIKQITSEVIFADASLTVNPY